MKQRYQAIWSVVAALAAIVTSHEAAAPNTTMVRPDPVRAITKLFVVFYYTASKTFFS